MSSFTPAPDRTDRTDRTGRTAIERRLSHVVLGLLLLAVSAWMIAVWLPGHHPVALLEALRALEDGAARGGDRGRGWGFAAWLYPWTFVLAAVIGSLGLGCVVSGLTYRPFAEVTCERCAIRVRARKDYRGLRCPLGAHYARRTPDARWPLLVGLVGLLELWLLALAHG